MARNKPTLTGIVLSAATGLGLAYLAIHTDTQEQQQTTQQEIHPTKEVRATRKQKKETLQEMLERHEGKEPYAYTDSRGNRTIGIGYNLERTDAQQRIEAFGLEYQNVRQGTRRLTETQIYTLLEEEITQAKTNTIKYLGRTEFEELHPQAQDTIINMAYNLGYTGLKQFKRLKEALIQEDYHKAAAEMEQSKWYTQTGRRAKELIDAMQKIKK